jgi:hypothetical protein
MRLFREKLLEALNQISVFIAERFETTTEEQVAFLKTPLIIPVRIFHSFEAHCIRSPRSCFINYTGSFSTHTLSSVIS